MKRIFNQIRNQPEEVRRHILHVSTIFFAVILLLLWVYSLGTSLSSPDTQAKVSDGLTPLTTLTGNLISGYKSISDSQ